MQVFGATINTKVGFTQVSLIFVAQNLVSLRFRYFFGSFWEVVSRSGGSARGPKSPQNHKKLKKHIKM